MNDMVKNVAAEAANQTVNFEKEMAATKNEVARLSAQIAAAVTTLGEIAKSQAKRGSREARHNVDALVSAASDRAGVVADAAQEAAGSIEDALAGVIQDRPFTTVFVALGVGFLTGIAWRR
jgi:ElaB/YqjD/DUF883 family membrane-anchored ribosome-binding protein